MSTSTQCRTFGMMGLNTRILLSRNGMLRRAFLLMITVASVIWKYLRCRILKGLWTWRKSLDYLLILASVEISVSTTNAIDFSKDTFAKIIAFGILRFASWSKHTLEILLIWWKKSFHDTFNPAFASQFNRVYAGKIDWSLNGGVGNFPSFGLKKLIEDKVECYKGIVEQLSGPAMTYNMKVIYPCNRSACNHGCDCGFCDLSSLCPPDTHK